MKVTIEKLNSEGKGIARNAGKVFFIPFSIPGETLDVEIVLSRKKYGEAEITKIREASPHRIEPPCPHFGQCGGCQLQHMNYATQLQWKKEIVKDALARIAKIQLEDLHDVVPSPREWNYRQRIQVHSDHQGRFGFLATKSHDIISVENCLIADEALNEKLKVCPKESEDYLKRIELRTDKSTAFSQVNPEQNENLRRYVLELLDVQSEDSVFDLYCGSGNFSIPIAQKAKKVYAVEKNASAINEAMKDDPSSGSIEWIRASVLAGLFQLQKKHVRCDAVVIDPPRVGMKQEVIENLLKFNPSRLVYVSCDPATFARDCALMFLKGYQLEKCVPLDMFPQTSHIEVIGLLTKQT